MMLAAHRFPVPGSPLPPVLLLHGFASSAAEDFLSTGWPEALNAAGRSAIAVDLPGHGESPAIGASERADTAAVVAAILEAADAGIDAAGGTGSASPSTAPGGGLDVIAYSLGARLAWELPGASTRVRRLVLGGLSPFEPFTAVDPAELEAALGDARGDGMAGGAGSAAAEPANPLVGMMAALISAPGRDTASLARLIPGLASQPFDPSAGGPQVPTLLVAGDADDMVEGIDGVAAGLPDAELVRVPGDHRGALDSPEFRAAAIAFLAR